MIQTHHHGTTEHSLPSTFWHYDHQRLPQFVNSNCIQLVQVIRLHVDCQLHGSIITWSNTHYNEH